MTDNVENFPLHLETLMRDPERFGFVENTCPECGNVSYMSPDMVGRCGDCLIAWQEKQPWNEPIKRLNRIIENLTEYPEQHDDLKTLAKFIMGDDYMGQP